MSKTFTLLALLYAGTTASAQQDTLTGSSADVTVSTATRSNLKQSQTGKIVTVINQQTIQNNVGRSLSELLNTQAGFFINGANNTPGTNQDIYFRGAGTGNMLVVIDGIPVFDPSQTSNSFDFNSIPLQQIERIEILRGGQSTLWGSDAVAGVIQLFLKKGSEKKIATNSSISYGSYATAKINTGISGTLNKLGYNLQYNYIKSRGISAAYDSLKTGTFDNDGFEQNNIQASVNYQFDPSLTAKLFGNFGSYHTDYDAGAFTDDKDYRAHNSNNLGGLSLQYHKKDFVWNLMASYQHAQRNFTDDSTDISSIYSKYADGRYSGNTTTIETFGNNKISNHVSLVSGLQYLHQNTEQSYFSTGLFGPYESKLGKDSANINQLSAYASLLITDIKGFNFEAGGRYNHHSIYGNKGTFTINPSYLIGGHTKLFVNISSAYKVPSLYQLYSSYGNKVLKPESSTTYELGIQTSVIAEHFSLRIAGFKRDMHNLIIFYTDPVTYAGKYINADKQNDYGAELETTVWFGRSINWQNNISYVNGEGTSSGSKIKNLYRRPNFQLSSSLTVKPVSNLSLIGSLRYIGKRLKGQYDIGPDKQPAYYTIDLYGAYQVQRNIRLFADFHNITNQEYVDIVGYTSKRFNMMAGIDFQF